MTQKTEKPRKGRGFRRAGALVEREIREAGESRGFAVTKLLTHWAEIAGQDFARRTKPVKVSYGRSGLGGTLTILTTGAEAPMVEMRKEVLRQRVNACYGYNAISDIRITQTAPIGFGDSRPSSEDAALVLAPDAKTRHRAARVTAPVRDKGLREALETLGANILSRSR